MIFEKFYFYYISWSQKSNNELKIYFKKKYLSIYLNE